MHALSTIRAMNTPEGIAAHKARLAATAPLGQVKAQEAKHSNLSHLLYAFDDYELIYGPTAWLTELSRLPLSTLRDLADRVYALVDAS